MNGNIVHFVLYWNCQIDLYPLQRGKVSLLLMYLLMVRSYNRLDLFNCNGLQR